MASCTNTAWPNTSELENYILPAKDCRTMSCTKLVVPYFNGPLYLPRPRPRPLSIVKSCLAPCRFVLHRLPRGLPIIFRRLKLGKLVNSQLQVVKNICITQFPANYEDHTALFCTEHSKVLPNVNVHIVLRVVAMTLTG